MPYDLLIAVCTVVIVAVGGLFVLGVAAAAVVSYVPSRPDAADLDEWDRP